MFNMKRISLGLLFSCLVVTLGWIGCGSGSSNDQGVSFTLLGFFGGPLEGEELPAGELGQFVPLSGGSVQGEAAPTTGGAVLTYLGVQNNMLGQFVRTDRVFMEYQVPGSTVSIPSSAFPLGVIIGPAGGNNSSLPDSFTGIAVGGGGGGGAGGGANVSVGNVSIAQFPIVPASIRQFVNLNRNSMPEPPFEMNVRVYVTGVTSAGDRLDTNEAYYQVIFTPDNLVQPTSNDGGGTDDEEESSSSLSEDDELFEE